MAVWAGLVLLLMLCTPVAGIPPPPPMVKLEPKAVAADDGRSALFASINKGTDITSGLKKVLLMFITF